MWLLQQVAVCHCFIHVYAWLFQYKIACPITPLFLSLFFVVTSQTLVVYGHGRFGIWISVAQKVTIKDDFKADWLWGNCGLAHYCSICCNYVFVCCYVYVWIAATWILSLFNWCSFGRVTSLWWTKLHSLNYVISLICIPLYIVIIILSVTRDYFDATVLNWNTSAHGAPWRVSLYKDRQSNRRLGVFKIRSRNSRWTEVHQFFSIW